MKTSEKHSNKTMIIVVTIILLLAGLSAYGLIRAVKDFQTKRAENAAERRVKLQGFMPQAPEGYPLTKEGYDPQAHCFDSCGYEYRHYRYSSEKAVCSDVIDAIERDKRSLTAVNELGEPFDSAACNERLANRSHDSTFFPVNFYASALMTYTVNQKPVTRATKFTRISIDPKAQEVIYRVSQEYMLYDFAPQRP